MAHGQFKPQHSFKNASKHHHSSDHEDFNISRAVRKMRINEIVEREVRFERREMSNYEHFRLGGNNN